MPRAHSKNLSQYFFAGFIALVLFCASAPLSVHAATLTLSPASTRVSVGNLLSVKMLVQPQGQTINSVDSILQFPTALLEVISVSKSTSIFPLWVEEPTFSNINGSISLSGGIPTPGFSGASGEVVSITFRAKSSGTANLVFGDSSVRLNDGLGTDVLTSRGVAVVEIAAASAPDVTTLLAPEKKTLSEPIVQSSTHPEMNAWYSLNTASFTWTVPSHASSLQTLVTKKADSIPTTAYDNSVSQRTVTNLSEGISYFHIRYVNSAGPGPSAHYKIQVDTLPPEKLDLAISRDDGRVRVKIFALDGTSGIGKYSVQIDDTSPLQVLPASLVDSAYEIPLIAEGEHTVAVRAYDRAGNYRDATTRFTSSALEAPHITLVRDRIHAGERARIVGTSAYPGSSVVVTVESQKKTYTYTTQVDTQGNFSTMTDELSSTGSYTAYAQLVVPGVSKGPVSASVAFRVTDTPFVTYTKSISYTLLTLCIAIGLLLALIFMFYLGWHKFFGLRKKLRKELKDTETSVHKAFGLYKDELENQLAKLEALRQDRDLNQKEQKIFKELAKNLTDIDEFIQKKLKKIK